MNNQSDEINIPTTGPITDEELWGTDAQPAAGNERDVICPQWKTPCTAWDGLNKQCSSSVCVYSLQEFAEGAA